MLPPAMRAVKEELEHASKSEELPTDKHNLLQELTDLEEFLGHFLHRTFDVRQQAGLYTFTVPTGDPPIPIPKKPHGKRASK